MEPPQFPSRLEAFNTIVEGMSKEEVTRRLGPPDEIRTLGAEGVLDGSRVCSSVNLTNVEVYRWAYGPRQPGAFAQGGVVSFDSDMHVIAACIPLYGRRFGSVAPKAPFPGTTSRPPADLSVRIEAVTLDKAPGYAPRYWSARVTLKNAGAQDFSTDCYIDTIARQAVVEVYDSAKWLIYRDDYSTLNNGFMSRSSTFRVGAGAERTEAVNFSPDDYYGPLPSGHYFLRVGFRYTEGAFIYSAMKQFKIPPISKQG